MYFSLHQDGQSTCSTCPVAGPATLACLKHLPSPLKPAVFFLTNVAFEIGAELLFLCIGFCWLRRHSNLRTSVKTLTKDPVHHIAAVATGSGDDISLEFSALSLATIALSLLPLLAWLTFVPVWEPSFGGADQGLRVSLSVCSLVGAASFVASGIRAAVTSSGLDRQRAMDALVAVGMVLYAMQKSFEVCVLVLNLERLCSDAIGKALIAFLCFEVLSVAIVVAALISVARPMPSCIGGAGNLQKA